MLSASTWEVPAQIGHVPRKRVYIQSRGGWAPGPGNSLLGAQGGIQNVISHHTGPGQSDLESGEASSGGTLWRPYEGEFVCLPLSVGLKAGQGPVHFIQQDKSAV